MRILGGCEKVDVRCELESEAGVMKNLGVQWDFLVCLEMLGGGGHEDVDAGFLLLPVRGLVRCRGLLEKELTIFWGEVSQSLF